MKITSIQGRQTRGNAGFATLEAVSRDTDDLSAAQTLHETEIVSFVGQCKAVCSGSGLGHRLRGCTQLYQLDLRVLAEQITRTRQSVSK